MVVCTPHSPNCQAPNRAASTLPRKSWRTASRGWRGSSMRHRNGRISVSAWIPVEAGPLAAQSGGDVRGIDGSPLDSKLLDATVRLAQLIDSPDEAPVPHRASREGPVERFLHSQAHSGPGRHYRVRERLLYQGEAGPQSGWVRRERAASGNMIWAVWCR